MLDIYRYLGWLPTLFVGKLLQQGTVGVIGCGRIGQAYARMMMEGHKMNVVYYDLAPQPEFEKYVNDYSDFLVAHGEVMDISFCFVLLFFCTSLFIGLEKLSSKVVSVQFSKFSHSLPGSICVYQHDPPPPYIFLIVFQGPNYLHSC